MIESKEFTTKRDGLTIRGTMFYRADRPSLGAVILSHGFMGDRTGVAHYARDLALAGYSAYTFDFCGGGINGQSDGDTAAMTVFTEREDLKAVMEYVLAEDETAAAAGKVVLWGFSQGGFVSALTAAQCPDRTAKLAMFFPALCIPDDARAGQMIEAHFDPADIPETFSCGPMMLGRSYAADVLEMDPFEEISSYPGEVLIVHGSDDPLVNVRYSRQALAAYEKRAAEEDRKPSCELVVLEGGVHGFDVPPAPQTGAPVPAPGDAAADSTDGAGDDKAGAPGGFVMTAEMIAAQRDEQAVTLVREFLGRTETVSGERFIKAPGSANPDVIPEQAAADIQRIMKPETNVYALDDRFVLRDGKKHPAAVIVPGGGYGMVCSFIEGVPFARRLNELGISAVIAYYRVAPKAAYPAPQDDLARAVKEVFDRAEEFCLDTENYSVWGASAGGHLAASFGTENMGYLKYGLPKPGTIVLCYPVITMDPTLTHMGTRDNLIGAESGADAEEFAGIEHHVTSAYPRTYLWCGDVDSCVPAENSRMMDRALAAAGIDHLFELIPDVDHGVGPGSDTAAAGWIDRAVKFWLG